MAEESLKQKTKKGLYWKFAEQFANYGMLFIIGIAMARVLSPEDYGITALPAVFMAIAGVFVQGGFTQALIRKPEVTDEDLSTAFYYSTSVGILFYIILFFASPWIADFYNTPVLKPLMRVTALTFIYSPLNTPQMVILNRRLDFKTPMKISVVAKICMGTTGLLLAYNGYGVWALVLSNMVSGIVNLIITCSVVRWFPKTKWSKESFSYLWGFGNKMMGAWLIGNIYENIAPVIIGKYYSPAQLGEYNRALGYARLPSQNITGTVQSVTFPVLSKMQDNPERLANNYRRVLRVSAFVVFPLMMLLAAIAHPLIIWMITDKWEGCVIFLQILCFSLMWYPIHAINLNLLQVTGKSNLYLRLEIAKKILGLTILCSTLPFGLICFCIGQVIDSLLCLIINTYYTKKIINVGLGRQLLDLTPILVLSLVMFASSFAIVNYFSNMYLQIAFGFLGAVVVYLGGALIFKFKEIDDINYLINFSKNNEQ